jgi:hypothetical protein
MTKEEREKVYWESITNYGIPAQIDMAIEEMSELTKALLKFRRYGCGENCVKYYDNVIEEIADVKIMLRQLEFMYQCEKEVNEWIDRKVERQIERLKNHETTDTADK